MTHTGASVPPAVPVPGLEPWWYPLTGRTRSRVTARYARAIADRLPPLIYGPDASAALKITLPPRLGYRYMRRYDALHERCALAVAAAARLARGAGAALTPDQVTVSVAVDAYAARPWGDAVIVVSWETPPAVIR